jgi:hypothetical protein
MSAEHTQYWKGAMQDVSFYWSSQKPEDVTLEAHRVLLLPSPSEKT